MLYFLSPANLYDKARNTKIIIKALEKFGVAAEASGRNDILTNGLKISGSAYKLSGPRALHHGTLLIDVDMNALERYLNPNKAKLKSKGVESVRSRVVNLKNLNEKISHESLTSQIISQFCEEYSVGNSQAIPKQVLEFEKLKEMTILKDNYMNLMDWKWRFGETPSFEHNLETRFEGWGIFDIYFSSKEGIIVDAKIYSDTLYPDLIDILTKHFVGVSYDSQGISTAIRQTHDELKTLNLQEPLAFLPLLQSWLLSSI